jgi:leucyl/phenylalanyl-tRNA---protein transferase
MIVLRNDEFPNPAHLDEEDDLIAIGGNLNPETLLMAYSIGYFPWFNEGELIMWWHPNPRLVLYPEEVKISKSMKQVLKKELFQVTFNTCFETVITECRKQRHGSGTWISRDIVTSYTALNRLGYAASVEVWQNEQLVGGLYGVHLQAAFFGESMFSKVSNASKVALIWLCEYCLRNNIHIIDCQQSTSHLLSMGAREISRQKFLLELNKAIQ